MASFGSYPTPVRRLAALSSRDTDLYLKHDGQPHAIYGGNKLRKIGRLLEDARRSGKTKIVTIGAIGSHHVLVAGIFGKLAGLQVEAVVVGQPYT
jgi:1-aminocyclopropane-1-carboxylate deaminase/D-cysteine desulfhydrase-like pyridoxal-dependent ACC family enzyme